MDDIDSAIRVLDNAVANAEKEVGLNHPILSLNHFLQTI